MNDSTANLGRNTATRIAGLALSLLPGALTVYLSFNAGGFFPQTPAFIALILALLLAARLALAPRPLEGIGRPLARLGYLVGLSRPRPELGSRASR